MNLYTGSSDLDLSLNVGNSPVDRSRADKITYLRKLTRVLYGLHNGVYLYSQSPFIVDVLSQPCSFQGMYFHLAFFHFYIFPAAKSYDGLL